MNRMHLKRWIKHLSTSRRAVRRAFPASTLTAIEAAVSKSERTHCGEIRFAVEASLEPHALHARKSARARALEVFAMLGVWDTAANNGVLIYVLLADRSVEIIADRGYNEWVSPGEWAAICVAMHRLFSEGRFEEGSIEGIRLVGELIRRHFPWEPGTRNDNELPNRPAVL